MKRLFIVKNGQKIELTNELPISYYRLMIYGNFNKKMHDPTRLSIK